MPDPTLSPEAEAALEEYRQAITARIRAERAPTLYPAVIERAVAAESRLRALLARPALPEEPSEAWRWTLEDMMCDELVATQIPATVDQIRQAVRRAAFRAYRAEAAAQRGDG